MNTRQEHRPGNNDDLVRELVQELTKVSGLLSEEMAYELAKGPAGSTNGRNSVLVGRLVRDLDPQVWKALAAKHDLGSWLAVPLDKDVVDSINSVTAVLDELIYQRDHDALTGLANRRCFDQYIAAELERAKRTGSYLSLALLDLDNFKAINDTRGHPCGDHVLRQLGAFLKQGHRSFDLVARTGGDEFSIVLPGSSCWNAKHMLERVSRDVAAQIISCENSPEFHIFFSGGIAGVGPELGYASVGELVDLADQALYDAKRKGKNQICLMPDAAAHSPAGTMVLSHEKKFLFSHME